MQMLAQQWITNYVQRAGQASAFATCGAQQ